jgi:hypothetical protein
VAVGFCGSIAGSTDGSLATCADRERGPVGAGDAEGRPRLAAALLAGVRDGDAAAVVAAWVVACVGGGPVADPAPYM